MFHCLNKRNRYRYETQIDEHETEQKELPRREQGKQKELTPTSDEGRRTTLIKLTDGSEMLYPIDYRKLYR